MVLWDGASAELLQMLRGHKGVVYSANWNAEEGVLVSCGDDSTVRLWSMDTKYSMYDVDQEIIEQFQSM